MDGKSYVAKAGNIAARKGILVVCSAGNEGDDDRWQFIVTPSDADSVLCIGGIENSLKQYEHISFASFGPTSDGRQKPNVCAFAHTLAATPHGGSNRYDMVYGTSFSCPLVAGFAACAWQVMKGKTAMEMFDLIQQSADLYPYCDYAFGYGVPQASFFVEKKAEVKPTFRFEKQDERTVSVIPLQSDSTAHLFYKDIDENGKIIKYGKQTVNVFDTAMSLDFKGGHHLVVHYRGYTADYRFEEPCNPDDDWANVRSNDKKIEYWTYDVLERDPLTDKADEERWENDYYTMLGTSINTMLEELRCNVWSPAARVGVRWQYHLSKAYGIGFGIDYGYSVYCFNRKSTVYNDLELHTGMANLVSSTDFSSIDKKYQREASVQQISVELFQRVRFVPGGSIAHKGLHWDLGGWFTWAYHNDYCLKYEPTAAMGINGTSAYMQVNNISPLKDHKWLYGVTTRFTYDWIGVYGRYRLNGIGKHADPGQVTLPRLEVGVLLML